MHPCPIDRNYVIYLLLGHHVYMSSSPQDWASCPSNLENGAQFGLCLRFNFPLRANGISIGFAQINVIAVRLLSRIVRKILKITIFILFLRLFKTLADSSPLSVNLVSSVLEVALKSCCCCSCWCNWCSSWSEELPKMGGVTGSNSLFSTLPRSAIFPSKIFFPKLSSISFPPSCSSSNSSCFASYCNLVCEYY